MRKKVSIVGSAPSKANAPYADMNYDIWCISGAVYSQSLGKVKYPDTEENGWNSVYRIDLLFEMHKPSIFADKIELLNMLGIPVMMQRKWLSIKSSIPYPADEVAEKIGDEFTSSIAYMMAYAIYKGYQEIRLDGVLMRHDSEYAYQRPGIKYYMGVARGLGIKVIVEPLSLLDGSQWRYGYDDIDRAKALIDKRIKIVKNSIEKEKIEIEKHTFALRQAEGAVLLSERLKEDLGEFWEDANGEM